VGTRAHTKGRTSIDRERDDFPRAAVGEKLL